MINFINSAPYLEKYTGKASRHQCPNCGDKNSFAYYLDGNTGEVIDKTVGRCNHESGCGYHYTPKQYFIDNPDKAGRSEQDTFRPTQTVYRPIVKPQPKPDFIPREYVDRSLSNANNFVEFLCGLNIRVETLIDRCAIYSIGSTKDGGIIYWQIDHAGNVRTGKVMKYDKETGHRLKEAGGVNWIHSLMKKRGLLPESFNLSQCLFGEHLLDNYYPSDSVVALVESEKSALIGSCVYGNYCWLATGGKSQLSIDKLRVLAGRTVVMFPDVDGFDYWAAKAKELEAIGCKVKVSTTLEKNTTQEDREAKIDIADWLIRELSVRPAEEVVHELTEAERALLAMEEKNPALLELVDAFGLELAE
jgi:hypothetical protein